MDTKAKTASVLKLLGFFQENEETSTSNQQTPSGTEEMSPIYPSNIGILPRGQLFSNFNKNQAEEAEKVYDYLISRKSFYEFLKAAIHFKEILNEGLFLYAFSVAMVHRNDTLGVQVPPYWQINPHNFFTNPVISDCIIPHPHHRRWPRPQPQPQPAHQAKHEKLFVTGTYRDPEFKISWWREDVGINLHHYHWHCVYPYNGVGKTNKEREGELFYYMHHQMVARYDAERLATGLLRVLPYADWNSPIQEGYNPHMTDYYGSNQYAPRPSGMILADNYRDPTAPVTVNHQMYNYNKLKDAIVTGRFLTEDNTYVPVNIDNLGAAVEASISSPNPELYGSIHNNGHDLISIVTDPDGRYKQTMGVMGENSTAIRDPLFFRWHKFIDDIFTMHTANLPRYTDKDLQFGKMTLDKITVQTVGCGEKNKLTTFMKVFNMDISESMFLTQKTNDPNSKVIVEVLRVNHDAFDYTFDVTNNTTEKVKAVFRVFMAPRFNEEGNRFKLNDQLNLFIEMDKFMKELSTGPSQISRSSTLSSVVKPPDSTVEDIKKNLKENSEATECSYTCPSDWCECGWPSNALVPRGTADGMAFDLFVMITNWSSDNCTGDLNQGTSYCGASNGKYPDGRPMGFPFDRPIDGKYLESTPFIDSFVKNFENMKSVSVSVVYDVAKKTDPEV